MTEVEKSVLQALSDKAVNLGNIGQMTNLRTQATETAWEIRDVLIPKIKDLLERRDKRIEELEKQNRNLGEEIKRLEEEASKLRRVSDDFAKYCNH